MKSRGFGLIGNKRKAECKQSEIKQGVGAETQGRTSVSYHGFSETGRRAAGSKCISCSMGKWRHDVNR